MWRIPLIAIFLLEMTACFPGYAEENARSVIEREYSVKAAVLYRLIDYINWPSQGPRVICIIGKDNFGSTADWINQKNNNVLLRKLPTTAGSKQCQIVFIDADESNIGRVLGYLEHQPILTVSDNPDFIKLGGMITTKIVEGRLQIEINLEKISNAHLSVIPPLIEIATRVIK